MPMSWIKLLLMTNCSLTCKYNPDFLGLSSLTKSSPIVAIWIRPSLILQLSLTAQSELHVL